MDHKERTKKQQEEAVQQELEQQLRDLGVTVSDAFRSGFDGYGDEIGRQAAQVGRSFTQLMNSVVGEVDDAFREAFGSERSQRREERRRRREARRSDGPMTTRQTSAAPPGAKAGPRPGRCRRRTTANPSAAVLPNSLRWAWP